MYNYEERSDEVIHRLRHYEEHSDEVIHSHTCTFWIATKIFDFLAMTSVCVMTNTEVHKNITVITVHVK